KKGRNAIQSGKSSIKLFINSDIAEINDFKEKMSKDVTSTTSCGSLLTLSTYTQVSSDQIPFENRKTVSQLLTSYKVHFIQQIHKSAYELLEQQVQFDSGNEFPRELLALECREFVFIVNKPETSKNHTPYTFKETDIPEIGPHFSNFTETTMNLRESTLAIEDCVPQLSSKKLKGDVSLLAEEDGQLSSTKSKPKVAHVTKDDCGKPSSTKQKSIILAMSKMKLAFTPVRVVRMWKFQNVIKPGDVGGIDLILLDDKVYNRILSCLCLYAFDNGFIMENVYKLALEGKCCILMNFKLSPNLGNYRGTPHPFKIFFVWLKHVKKNFEEIPNDSLRFHCISFDDLLSQKHDEKTHDSSRNTAPIASDMFTKSRTSKAENN
ncbi:hypothetical protein HID58_006462, partial [Brassica napus]